MIEQHEQMIEEIIAVLVEHEPGLIDSDQSSLRRTSQIMSIVVGNFLGEILRDSGEQTYEATIAECISVIRVAAKGIASGKYDVTRAQH